jgi:hypothetical protein
MDLKKVNRYQGASISFLTKHQKEKVVQPLFNRALKADLITIDNYDTDQLGTFTRDISRYGNQLDAARQKARIAMEISGVKYGLGSEGSFIQDPYTGIIPINYEIVVFIDSILNIEIIGHARASSISNHATVKSWQELSKFARLNKFPRHQLVVRPDHQDHPAFAKGIDNLKTLEEAFHQAFKLSKKKRVFVEHDLRALANPTRMKNIKEATKNLIARMVSCCPKCHTPGFWITRNEAGLPCALCEMPSNQTKEKIYTCLKCEYEKKESVKDKKADPAKCNFCNP